MKGVDHRSGGGRRPSVYRLLLPFLGALGIGAALIVGLIIAAARGENTLARERSVELARAVLTAEMRDLVRVSKDHAWWDEAVDRLVERPDAAWAEANIGHGPHRTFGITESFVLDAQDRLLYHFRYGKPVPIGSRARPPSGFAGLIEEARHAPQAGPIAVSAMVLANDTVQMAAIAAIAPANAGGRAPDREPHLLVFAKALDSPWLARIASDYGIDGLSVALGETNPGQPSLPLLSVDGSRLGALVWAGDEPGHRLLRMLLPPAGVAFATIGLISLFVFRRVERSRSESAEHLAAIIAKNEELEKLAALQRATLDSVGEGISVFDKDLRLVIWNRAYAEMQDYPEALLTPGTSLVDILRFDGNRGGRDPRPPDEAIAEQLAAAVRCDRTPTEYVRPDGRVLEMRRNPMPGGGFVNSFRDISERKRVERELMAARDQAQLANRAKSEFLANMSHELRTPLNAILGFSEIMKEELFGPLGCETYRGYVRDIHLSGRVLLDLISDILDLSRIETGKYQLQEEDVEIKELFTAVLRIIRERAQSAGLAIDVEIDRRLPKIKADKRALKQILLNLLSNAVKFTPRGGRITLRAERDGDGAVRLSVADTGIGIAAEDIPRAMAVFGQVDSRLARKYTGTGLGLPLSRALAELHRGTLQLASEPGVGTAVSVRLPPDRVAA